MILKMVKSIDWILLLSVFLIFIIGLITISSAVHILDGGSKKMIIVQALAFCVGLCAMSVFIFIDYNKFKEYRRYLYVLNIFLLLLVYIPGLGVQIAGARSWINLKVLYFQTSELVKISFILGFASYMEDKKGEINKFKDLIPIGLYCSPVLLMLLKQPDLGTTIVFISIIAGMLFVCDMDLKLIRNLILILLISIPIIYPNLENHQKQRIDEFFDNYQLNQSIIAIGSGKVFGKGLYQGTQNRYNFLPVQESDFIFAVLVEETGLLGASVLCLLFLLFLIRILRIAAISKDFYGSLVCTGVLFMFLYQIVQNIGMTIGLMPITGVTLPFVSYGGSSMVTSFMALGLVLNVSMRRRKINF
ncbi:rod shape-determining protein RodA [Peptostreptococcaceae bacterium AGR-M142]